MKPTDITNPEFFHRVVDCQYACPAHTPVPEYIRLIAHERYTDAYMLNWESNVFPGILGRVCDRPCEPACRRGRLKNEEPVAICRLKRVAADNKENIVTRLPSTPIQKNGKKVALLGGGPASLTVARDLLPLGYHIVLYDEQHKAGGMMRSQIPAFRLPETVLDEEVDYIATRGVECRFGKRIESLKSVMDEHYDAIFIGTGAPQGRDLFIPGREQADKHIHIGVDWLAGVAFGHIQSTKKRVIVLGGGNTAMDCCRTARRLGGENVKVIVRSPFADMKASPWEKEDAMHEDIPILDNHVPKEFVIVNGAFIGVRFEKVRAVYDSSGKRTLVPTGEDPVLVPCDEVLIAIGQDTAFPWIERDIGIAFDKYNVPIVNRNNYRTSHEKIFIGGDAAFGPENIISAVADGHQAAISIHHYCSGKSIDERLQPGTNLVSQKMGIHDWSFDSKIEDDVRHIVPLADLKKALSNRKLEVELGFNPEIAFKEAQRCLNCDVQTVFTDSRCIECDACVDICPTNCITFTGNEENEDKLRSKLSAKAHNIDQPLYVSGELMTTRSMIKDENVCLHCGLCAERCPTAAWDMQKYSYSVTKVTPICTQ